ncbi:splicing factor 3b subunit 3 [Stylonychia lemnae]|uniref:Splicing factor 3b subunit 3 n=1 Tax=Stylonychia lemnae TaxID=5949 RepID=A0A077ZQR7_STYLE|nr:splicing factor 3b subunit 3 [Stylonychia lemnae]|eukprot:CDW71789.1 splicing factor 3b subunit 3 [Stylonychia lemnae]
MYLYSLTLNQATAINNSVYGNFSGPKQHEIVVSKGKILEMMRLDVDSQKMQLVYRQEVFGLIRKMIPFRLLGMQKDFLVIGSDSGRIVILEYDSEHNKFVKIHQETFGKTGCRRIVPGEYLAADPKGRAIMIGAVEKQKYVYILNRDSQNKLTISSPLEAHKPHTITFAMCGVDVGIENPQFACLEVDYGESDSTYSAVVTGQHQKMLVFYEMDLGLNHVVRKYSTPVENSAHLLIQVPGEPYGPSGIIVVCENMVCYKKVDHDDRECSIPIRYDQVEERGTFFTCNTTHTSKDLFFFLLCSEYGDIFKVNLDFTNGQVHGMSVQYFDTTTPNVCINILRPGFLFCASEFANHVLYMFLDIGENDPNKIVTYSADKRSKVVNYNPRALLNLQAVDEFQNLASINDMKVEDLTGEGNPQIYLACGRGAQGCLRVLRHGLTVVEMAVTGMPQKPINVMTVKGKIDDIYDKYMIVSFQQQTLVLSIGQEKVTEVKDSGLTDEESTLHVGILQDNSYVQITPKSIIHIKGDPSNRKRAKWDSEKGKIIKACSNQRQVVISIQGGQIVYFELDDMSDTLVEIESRFFDSEIACIDIAEVPEGRQRCRFLAVGFVDKTVKIMSLDPESCLQRISMQALPALPESVALINFKKNEVTQQQQQLFLHVGLVNGVLLRTLVDNVTGVLSDSRTRFLGTNSIQLAKVKQANNNALIALCNKPWLCYSHMSSNKVNITPLSYEHLEVASSFCSEKNPDGGIVAISGNTLRIISVDRLGENFTNKVMPLRYTPSKIQIHRETNYLVILEKDHNSLTYSQRLRQKEEIAEKSNDQEYLNLDDSKISYPRTGQNKFASCIRIVDPFLLQTLELIEFENNEVVFSHFIATTLGNPGETHLILGTAMNVTFQPRSCSLGFIKTYKFVNNGQQLQLLHSTPCEDIPMAFNEYKGRLIAGVGSILRVYELGQKKLLRKVENKNFQAAIIQIQVDEGRIYAGDLQESVHVLKYKPEDIQLYTFADDVLNRWLTSFCLLDHDTLAGVDKFENIFINRLPLGCEDDAEDDPTATKFKWENGYLNGAAFKMDPVCQFYIGEVGTCIQKCSLNTLSGTNSEIILYGTTSGSLGALLPFETKEEIDFFVHLEMYLRIEAQPLCGRDHVTFRSSYVPVKDVVDGDLCEQYASLEFNKQRVLAEEMDRTPPEVMKKLENMRNKIL